MSYAREASARRAHHRPLARPATLVVPQVVVGDLEFIRPGIVLQQAFLAQLVDKADQDYAIEHRYAENSYESDG